MEGQDLAGDGGVLWRVRFVPVLEAERGGEAHRLRTRQQLLLLARLAAEPGTPLDRAEAAEALWPDAESDLARTYLRRAVMEMRHAGIEIVSTEAGLAIPPGRVESDFEDAAASGALGSEGERLAPGWESPMLDSIRRLIQARARKVRGPKPPPKPSPEMDASRFVLSLLGEALVAYDPARAMALVAAHRYDFYTKAPEPDLLAFFHRLCKAAPEPSADRVAVMCVMAGISSIQTLYHAANELYLQAIRDAAALEEGALLARAHAMRCGTLIELRQWSEAEEAAEQSVEIAKQSGDSPGIAFSLAARASYEWHVGLYDESVQSYLAAIEHAEPGPHRDNARHNLSFVWGVLGGRMETPPVMVEEPEYAGTHLPGSRFYELFSLGIGYARYRDAARGAAGALSLAADGGMERLIAIGLDNASIAFARLGHTGEAAACVRLSTRLRFLLSHRRSPMEYDALRRHVPGRYFGPGVQEWENKWRSPDPGTTAHRVAARLRLAAG